MQQQINFGMFPEHYSSFQNSKIVIVPVPYDMTSTWLKGADKGPQAILEASVNLEFYDIETHSEVFRHGIFTDEPLLLEASPEEMVEAVERRVSTLIKHRKFVVVLGGEHSVSIGAVYAHCKAYKGVSVLHLDAHADLRDNYNGSRYNHACVMARVKEMADVVQVGIRSMDVSETASLDSDKVFFAKDIFNSTAWIESAVSRLSDNVYLTLDLDVFDPSIMPSTGTPEPGGLFWYDLMGLLRAVFLKRNVVGLDVVELCPNQNNKGPDFLAAKLVYTLLSYKFEKAQPPG